MSDFWVNGIVSTRDKQPYIQLSNETGMIAQLSMGQARKIAHDILVMCSRTEMDAMVLAWFEKITPAHEAAVAMMHDFREYRAAFDQEVVEGRLEEPPQGS